MKNIFFLFSFALLFLSQESVAQINEEENDSITVGETKIDSLYREDQFYFGFNFNLLTDKPKTFRQSGFSGGFQLGYFRDMPINKKRTFAIAPGLGWSFNSYGQNLYISEDFNEESFFRILDSDTDYSSNRFTTYSIDAPLELRWRNSSPSKYKFWRVYAGFKVSYLYFFKSNYQGEGGDIIQTKVEELNRWRYGLTFSFGFNSINFNFYYSLNTMFDTNIFGTNQEIGLKPLKIGLIFYIL